MKQRLDFGSFMTGTESASCLSNVAHMKLTGRRCVQQFEINIAISEWQQVRIMANLLWQTDCIQHDWEEHLCVCGGGASIQKGLTGEKKATLNMSGTIMGAPG